MASPSLSSAPISLLSLTATQLRVGENRLTVTGDKGYCMVRATHGELSEGGRVGGREGGREGAREI